MPRPAFHIIPAQDGSTPKGPARPRAAWPALIALLHGMLLAAANAGTVFTPTMAPASHVDIKLECWLETRPLSGFVPVTLRIQNGDTQQHTWTLRSKNGYNTNNGLQLDASLTVAPGQESERMIYVPFIAESNRSYAAPLRFEIEGFGVENSTAGAFHLSGGYGGIRTEFIGMGKKLASRHWSQLRDNLKSTVPGGSHSHSDLHGSEVDMTQAPDDWRGYAGFAQLWLDESEWLSMRPAAKGAMLDWLSMGGKIYVLAKDDSDARAAELELPAKVDKSRLHGAGEVVLMKWDGTAFPFETVAREIRKAGDTSMRQSLEGYESPWTLRNLVGDLNLKAGLIFGFIAIFGILVGPVNLFWFAPPGRRQRMFWTTPLLSLAGSLLLITVMVLQDGIGGNGARLTFAILQPQQKRLAVIQEQVSRTGVLLGRSFPITEPGWMHPLNLEADVAFTSRQDNNRSFSEEEQTRSGDWFASRSVQAHLLETVRPSRATVEVFPAAGGGAPSVLSSFETPLSKLFVVDESSVVWLVEDLGVGEKKQAKPANAKQLSDWLRDGPQKLAGPVIGAALLKLKERPGCVFGQAASTDRFAMPTLSAIRWDHDQAYIAGPYVKRH